MYLPRLLCATLAPIALGAQAVSPSFDCAQAEGQVEQLICRDADLAVLDRELATAYDRALERDRQDGSEDPRAMQRGWV
jgi:uncharacterized protein